MATAPRTGPDRQVGGGQRAQTGQGREAEKQERGQDGPDRTRAQGRTVVHVTVLLPYAAPARRRRQRARCQIDARAPASAPASAPRRLTVPSVGPWSHRGSESAGADRGPGWAWLGCAEHYV
jgi:hypothetical protein